MADDDLDRLIHQHLEGDLDEVGAAILGRLVAADAAAARRLLDQACVTEHLPEAIAGLRSATARLRQTAVKQRPALRRWSRLAAVAAMLVIGLMAAWAVWGPVGYGSGGTLVALDGLAWVHGPDGDAPAVVGAAIPSGSSFVLPDGAHADLRFADGTILALSDSSELRFGRRPGDMHLEHGTCVAEVAPQHGRSFVLHTPDIAISVIGTRFLVTATAQTTTVSVEHGRVAVASGAQHIDLDSGQWTRATGDQVLEAHDAGDLDLERGLLGWWPCDERNGEEIHDRSAWGRHGRIIGKPEGAWSDGGNGASAIALGNHGFSPDGIKLPSIAPGAIPGLTATMRVKWLSGASPALFGEGPARFGLDATGHPLVDHRGTLLVGPNALPAGEWHYVAWRWISAGRWDIFVDGRSVAGRQDDAWAGGVWSSWPLSIGHPADPRIGDFALVLNQVRVYGRALSDSEISAVSGL